MPAGHQHWVSYKSFPERALNLRLGVNVDHVATLRQARGGHEPEPVAAALLAQSAGAHGITVHLRGDRRHIQERDLRLLKEVLAVPLNVECAATPEALELSLIHISEPTRPY